MLKEAAAVALSKPHLDWALDDIDLKFIHFAGCFIGVLLCVAVMQLLSTGALRFEADCIVSYYLRRLALWLLALSMCWAMAYSLSKGWQPWPPDVAIVYAIDLLLAAGVLVSAKRSVQKPRLSR